MSVIEPILNRKSTKIFKKTEPISKEAVETIIEAAIQAPNHHITEPWKFFVMQGENMQQFYDAAMEFQKNRDISEQEFERMKVKMISKTMVAPTVILAVYSKNKNKTRVKYEEDILAVGAAIQNMLVQATSMGIDSIWKTGPVYNATEVKSALGIEEDEEVVGAIFFGENDNAKELLRKRTDKQEKTIWL